MSEKDMTRTMISIKKDLIVYGSDRVIEKFFLFERLSHENKQVLYAITDIIIEMRKDMGSPKTKITVEQFFKSLVHDEDDYQKLKKDGII